VTSVDIFLHDSDHTYKNMSWEFQTAWDRMKSAVFFFHTISIPIMPFPTFARKMMSSDMRLMVSGV
jgi:hypothetical protein